MRYKLQGIQWTDGLDWMYVSPSCKMHVLRILGYYGALHPSSLANRRQAAKHAEEGKEEAHLRVRSYTEMEQKRPPNNETSHSSHKDGFRVQCSLAPCLQLSAPTASLLVSLPLSLSLFLLFFLALYLCPFIFHPHIAQHAHTQSSFHLPFHASTACPPSSCSLGIWLHLAAPLI